MVWIHLNLYVGPLYNGPLYRSPCLGMGCLYWHLSNNPQDLCWLLFMRKGVLPLRIQPRGIQAFQTLINQIKMTTGVRRVPRRLQEKRNGRNEGASHSLAWYRDMKVLLWKQFLPEEVPWNMSLLLCWWPAESLMLNVIASFQYGVHWKPRVAMNDANFVVNGGTSDDKVGLMATLVSSGNIQRGKHFIFIHILLNFPLIFVSYLTFEASYCIKSQHKIHIFNSPIVLQKITRDFVA